MGQEDLQRMNVKASKLKAVLLENKNIDVLLYLAKYNPKITVEDIIEKFGKDAIYGLKNLKIFNLVEENNSFLTLTDEGLFQVEGLLTLV